MVVVHNHLQASTPLRVPAHVEPSRRELIQLDLRTKDAEALLNHVPRLRPKSFDPREDTRLKDALDDVAEAIERHLQAVALQHRD